MYCTSVSVINYNFFGKKVLGQPPPTKKIKEKQPRKWKCKWNENENYVYISIYYLATNESESQSPSHIEKHPQFKKGT